MRSPQRQRQRQQIEGALDGCSKSKRPLPGVEDYGTRRVLALQVVASIRREDYYRYARERHAVSQRVDPRSQLFNPEKGVGFFMQSGDVDEATWLAFLMTFFGKPHDDGWKLLRDVYGRLSAGEVWDWKSVSSDPKKFEEWLTENSESFCGKFGNHRKYMSLNPKSHHMSPASIISGYVRMIGEKGHQAFFNNLLENQPNDPFDTLFNELKIPSFGRLGKFDYLMMLSRYGIISMHPQSAYLRKSSGPIRGACLLFFGNTETQVHPDEIQDMLNDLDTYLNVGMAVLEDALCNWQKSPNKFKKFNG